MAIDNLPTPPSTNDPANFNTRADAFMLAMQTFQSQVNAALALMNSPSNCRIVDVVRDSNLNIAGGAIAVGNTIDGVTLTAGMRVLLVAQTTGAENGIYDVPASGIAARSTDANTSGLLAAGLTIQVTRGTNYKGTRWVHRTDPGFTLNTTALVFVRPGERVESNVTAYGIVGGTTAGVTSVVLQPGRWRLSGVVNEDGSGATNYYGALSISTTSGNLSSGTTEGKNRIYWGNNLVGGSQPFGSGCIPSYEVNITVQTTYYLNVLCSSQSDTFYGSIHAERLA